MVRRLITFLPFVVVFAGFLLRLPEIHRPLWTDELITVSTLKDNPLRNPLYIGTTTNLPLYFWLVRVVSEVFYQPSPEYLRYLGIIINLLNAWIIYRWLKNIATTSAGIIFLTVFLFAPLQVHYSAELRPYVLSQLIATLLFIQVYKLSSHELRPTKSNLVLISLTCVAGLLSHYSFYIVAAGIYLTFLSSGKEVAFILKTAVLPLIFSSLIIFMYQANPLVQGSLEGMGLRRDPAETIARILDLRHVNRIKEVVSNYYYYGLYYYRLDYWAQFFFKKILLILLLASIVIIRTTGNRRIKNAATSAISVLFISLVASLVGEILGYYPFGGRHIMPFSFLLYLVVSLGISELRAHFIRAGFLLLLVCLPVLISFVLFQSCSQLFRTRYTGTNEPQGDIFGYCLSRLMMR